MCVCIHYIYSANLQLGLEMIIYLLNKVTQNRQRVYIGTDSTSNNTLLDIFLLQEKSTNHKYVFVNK